MRHQTSNVQPVHHEGDHPPKPVEQQPGDDHRNGRIHWLTDCQLGSQGAQHQEWVGRQNPSGHGVGHGQLLLVKDDVVLEHDDQERTASVEPKADLERLDQPVCSRRPAEAWDAVDVRVVQEEVDGHPVRAKVEALVRVMQAAQERGRLHHETEGDKAREDTEEDNGEEEETLPDGYKPRERVGLLREEHGEGAGCHGGFEPRPREVGETLADRHLGIIVGFLRVIVAVQRAQVTSSALEGCVVVLVDAKTSPRHYCGVGWIFARVVSIHLVGIYHPSQPNINLDSERENFGEILLSGRSNDFILELPLLSVVVMTLDDIVTLGNQSSRATDSLYQPTNLWQYARAHEVCEYLM